MWPAAERWQTPAIPRRELRGHLRNEQSDQHARATHPTNSGSRCRANIDTLKGATLEFEMMWDTADDDFTAICEAFLNNTAIEFAVLDGAIKVSVTAKPTYSSTAPTWMTVT